MSTTSSTCLNNGPSLLLIEPTGTEQILHVEQLSESRYRVTRADNPRDVFLMRTAFFFSVAVLNDAVGFLTLRASAQVVRHQWPQARILILGKAPNQFDDHLYDETVQHGADQDERLIVAIDRLTEDTWDQRSHHAYAEWLVGKTVVSSGQVKRTQESDPRKVPAPVPRSGYTRDWPAGLR